jgi:hypothetical protein
MLDLSYCSQIRYSGVVVIAEKCSKLLELNLNGNKNITDLNLISISNNCKNLKINRS